jgi:dienelactone hydrolase
LTELTHNVGQLAWTSDAILFTADEKEDDEYSIEYTSDIYAISAAGGDVRKLTTGLGAESGIAVSTDGKRLAYVFSREPGAPEDVMLVDIAADGTFQGEPVNMTESWDLDPAELDWAGGSRSLRWMATTKGNRHVFESSGRGSVHQVTNGDRTLSGVSYARKTRLMAYGMTDAMRVGDVFVSQSDGAKEVRVTTLNDEWLNTMTLSAPERLTWTVGDGTEIEGWLMKPVGYTPGVKYPMILKIHGGPHSAYGNYWFDLFHVLSGAGFFVLYPNPRGSTGYGHEFTYATRARWGELDSEDFLTGVDAAIAKYPDIDSERVGVSGGSYGGFMTAWLTATTDKFAVANPSRMISNWESWYGASDAQRLTEYEFNGEPWEVRELYRRLSPLSYVENVYTPTLIIQSENDYRTPTADSEQWYMALKKRGVPAEMALYPRSTHDLSRTGEPLLLVDRLNRIKTWFEHWLIEEKLTRTLAKERYGVSNTLSLSKLRNLEYTISIHQGRKVRLEDGRFSIESPAPERLLVLASDSVAFGDVDGDGDKDAGIVIVSQTSGTGVFCDLVLVRNIDGLASPGLGSPLGDRVKVESLRIGDGEIRVQLIQHGPDDPMCCPTERATRRFVLDGDTLAEVK